MDNLLLFFLHCWITTDKYISTGVSSSMYHRLCYKFQYEDTIFWRPQHSSLNEANVTGTRHLFGISKLLFQLYFPLFSFFCLFNFMTYFIVFNHIQCNLIKPKNPKRKTFSSEIKLAEKIFQLACFIWWGILLIIWNIF